MLCSITLYYVIVYVKLYDIMLCYIILYYIMVCFAILEYIMFMLC